MTYEEIIANLENLVEEPAEKAVRAQLDSEIDAHYAHVDRRSFDNYQRYKTLGGSVGQAIAQELNQANQAFIAQMAFPATQDPYEQRMASIPMPMTNVRVTMDAPDPYAEHTRRERERNYAGLTFDHPDNVRARKLAALRDEMSKPSEPRFPVEGRSDRVYAANRGSR